MERDNSFDAMLDRVSASGADEQNTIEAAKAASAIIEAIVSARIRSGLTQRQLAAKCGIKQSAIARMESFQAIPRLDTVIKVASCLDVSICVEQKTAVTVRLNNIVNISEYLEPVSYQWTQVEESIGKEGHYGTIG